MNALGGRGGGIAVKGHSDARDVSSFCKCYITHTERMMLMLHPFNILTNCGNSVLLNLNMCVYVGP